MSTGTESTGIELVANGLYSIDIGLAESEYSGTVADISLMLAHRQVLITEEDLLQEANQNIIKALSNDYSIPINKLTFDQGSGAGAQKGGAKAPKGGTTNVKSDDPSLINSTTNNVSYYQRNLEQFLIYSGQRISS